MARASTFSLPSLVCLIGIIAALGLLSIVASILMKISYFRFQPEEQPSLRYCGPPGNGGCETIKPPETTASTTTSTSTTTRTTTTTGTTTTTTQQPGGEGDEDSDTTGDYLNEACKWELNKYRTRHGSQPLVFSKALLEHANNAAAFYAQDPATATLRPADTVDAFKTSFVKKPDLPETIGSQFGIVSATSLPKLYVDNTCNRWYKRKDGIAPNIQPYNYDDPNLNQLWAYSPFTQMIWNDTQKFACSISNVTAGNTRILSVVFEPAGNIVLDGDTKLYVKNVGKAV